jgi:rhodanese-related sulfurtransferase
MRKGTKYRHFYSIYHYFYKFVTLVTFALDAKIYFCVFKHNIKKYQKMKSISITAFMLISFLFIACTPKAQTTTSKDTKVKVVANPIERLNAAEFKKKVETASDILLVDVRTAREFVQGHIKGAINFDYYQRSSFMTNMNKLDKSKPIFIYCLTGSRSRSTANKLKNAGFTKIYDLNGGVKRWYQNGFKLVQ